MDDHFMTKDEWEMFNHDKRMFKWYAKNRYYCYCGHSVYIKPDEQRMLCSWCGHWVYRNKRKQNKNIEKIKKEEFRNNLRRVIDEDSIK